jgi:hypothetical protein
MRQFQNGCLDYFDNKETPADKQVKKILLGLKDHCIRDWTNTERKHLHALSFDKFMTEFKAGYLEEDWEETTRRELLSMTQGNTLF